LGWRYVEIRDGETWGEGSVFEFLSQLIDVLVILY
jgi:hypothetical protein